jgi:GNAT superfamily N-acetyltransferase
MMVPLEYWQVFLLQAKSQIVGVSGLYRQPGMPSHVCWLGWFAIRPQFRRQGFGTAAIHQLCHAARSAGSIELWVTPVRTMTPLELSASGRRVCPEKRQKSIFSRMPASTAVS